MKSKRLKPSLLAGLLLSTASTLAGLNRIKAKLR